MLIGVQGICSRKAYAMQRKADGRPRVVYSLDQYSEQADGCNMDCQARFAEASHLEKRLGDDRITLSKLEWAIISPEMSPEIKELYVGRIRPLLICVDKIKPLTSSILEEHALAIEMAEDIEKSDIESFEARHEKFVTKRAYTAERWSALERWKLTIAGEADKIRETIRPNNSLRLIDQIKINSRNTLNSSRLLDQVNSQNPLNSRRLLNRIRPIYRR